MARSLPRSGSVELLFVPTGLIRKARDIKGRYTSVQGLAKQAHERIAKKISDMAVEELQQAIDRRGRPQRYDERLFQALESERNRGATVDGAWFLSPSYMNSSAAKMYWRRLEYGGTMRIRVPFYAAGKQKGEYDLNLLQTRNREAPTIPIEIPAYHYAKRAIERFYGENLHHREYDRVFADVPGYHRRF